MDPHPSGFELGTVQPITSRCNDYVLPEHCPAYSLLKLYEIQRLVALMKSHCCAIVRNPDIFLCRPKWC